MHYAAYTEFVELPFDVTRLRHKKPLPVRLGEGAVLWGFELCIRSMKKGEKSKFLVDPALAFMERGVPPRIPGSKSTTSYSCTLCNETQGCSFVFLVTLFCP